MSRATEMAERHGRVLAELAELGLALARDLSARAQGAPDAEAAQGLSLAFQRVSRSVRQCLALEVRLERERWQCAREARTQAIRNANTRKAQLRAALTRAVWDEADRDDSGAPGPRAPCRGTGDRTAGRGALA